MDRKPEIVLADPQGSIMKEHFETGKAGTAGSWMAESIGEDFMPAQLYFSLVKKAYTVTDREAFHIARELLLKEGIFAGPSTGILVGAALKYAAEQKSAKKIVTFACDTGNKYLSKMYSDAWMSENGFMNKQKQHNDL